MLIGLIWLLRVVFYHECDNVTLGLPKPVILKGSEQITVSN
jgi:hypothetical protein